MHCKVWKKKKEWKFILTWDCDQEKAKEYSWIHVCGVSPVWSLQASAAAVFSFAPHPTLFSLSLVFGTGYRWQRHTFFKNIPYLLLGIISQWPGRRGGKKKIQNSPVLPYAPSPLSLFASLLLKVFRSIIFRVWSTCFSNTIWAILRPGLRRNGCCPWFTRLIAMGTLREGYTKWVPLNLTSWLAAKQDRFRMIP